MARLTLSPILRVSHKRRRTQTSKPNLRYDRYSRDTTHCCRRHRTCCAGAAVGCRRGGRGGQRAQQRVRRHARQLGRHGHRARVAEDAERGSHDRPARGRGLPFRRQERFHGGRELTLDHRERFVVLIVRGGGEADGGGGARTMTHTHGQNRRTIRGWMLIADTIGGSDGAAFCLGACRERAMQVPCYRKHMMEAKCRT